MALREVSPPANLPTASGGFVVRAVRDEWGIEHAMLVKGDLEGGCNVLFRVHSECLTGDAFGSDRCDCRGQLALAMQEVEREGVGAILYLRQEGRGIGLFEKIRAYQLQDSGFDTVDANTALGHPADSRDYGLCAEVLRRMGVKSIRLLSNNPSKLRALEASGVTVNSMIPLRVERTVHNERYLETKKIRLGHAL